MIKLEEILKVNCKKENFTFRDGTAFNGVSIDSRDVKRGEIFFAIKGENTDGHNFIDKVVKNKAKLLFVNKNWYAKNKNKIKGTPCCVVADTVSALGELAKIHKDSNPTVIFCIGGSNGKTTAKDLVASVLKKKFKVLKTEGNYNNHIGLPLTLLGLDDRHTISVVEAGSNHFGEIEYLCRIAGPDCAMITNIGREHLEFFRTVKGVAREEFALFDYVRTKSAGACLMNLDDNHIKEYYKKHKYPGYFTYSFSPRISADVKGKMLGYDDKFRPVIEVSYGKLKFRTFVNAFGRHSFYNGLAAAASGLFFGISPVDISRAMQNYKAPTSNRMHAFMHRGILIIDDTYNSNPDSVANGLATLKEYKTNGKKLVVLGDMLEMGNAGASEHKKVGNLVKKLKLDYCLTYGRNSYNTFIGAKGMENNYYFDDKDALSEFLKKVLSKGDVAYIKGSRGMKMEDVIHKIKMN